MWHISKEENTLGLDKKKTTDVGSASYYFLVLPFCADSISKEVAGFSPLCFPEENSLCLLSLVMCLCFIAVIFILSVKRS